MDKSGAKILAGCIFSTAIVLVLFFLAYRFTQPSCELIIIEMNVLKESVAAEWPRAKPMASHEKSLIMRMAAFLEYHHTTLSASPMQASHSNKINSSQIVQQSQLELVHSIPGTLTTTKQSQQQVFGAQQQTNLTTQKGAMLSQTERTIQNQTIAPINNSTILVQQEKNFSSTDLTSTSAPPQPNQLKKRFLPLELNDVELIKTIDESRAKYVLNFNCSIIRMVFVRKPERIYVESIKIELKVPNKQRTKCDIKLPNNMAFATDVGNSGMAHYRCTVAQTFACLDKSLEPVVSLHTLGIEWETGNSLANSSHQLSDFTTEPALTCGV